ncbi:MAG TPA: NADH dehydrogenase (quinone) subunit D, partial [Pyrinomonadaceae bacterium]|nr:NADH dehydrogenase (quinone) subunit D [Pyrinomonadaceae bacterium]
MSVAVENISSKFEVLDQSLESQMTLSMGPQHPSTHGVLRLELQLDGEMVIKAVPDIGYLHTGMEKLFEYKKYQQGIVITDRMDYLNPLGNNLAYVMAAEKLLNLEIPERAQVIRVLFCELQRIASHMVWFGTHALDIGAMSPFFYAFRQREKILNLIEAASGGRMTPSYFRIGGLMMDLPAGFERRCKQFLENFPAALDQFETLVTGNTIWQSRTKGIGVITAEEAIDWGLTGPCLRGSGVNLDLRRDNPYSGYETYDFEVPVEPDGDVWARFRVRMRELYESYKIVVQALERLKPGPIKADAPKVVLPDRDDMRKHMDSLIHHFLIVAEGFNVPEGEVYLPIEGSKGELGVYMKSNGGPKPDRVHFRGPSFVNLAALPVMS